MTLRGAVSVLRHFLEEGRNVVLAGVTVSDLLTVVVTQL